MSELKPSQQISSKDIDAAYDAVHGSLVTALGTITTLTEERDRLVKIEDAALEIKRAQALHGAGYTGANEVMQSAIMAVCFALTPQESDNG